MNLTKQVLYIYLLLCLGSVFAQENLKSGNILSTHRLQIFEGFGPSITRSDYSDVGFGYNIKAGADYFLTNYSDHYFGGRVSANLMEVSASDASRNPTTHNTEIIALNLSLLYSFQYEQHYYPYASMGIAITYFDPRDNNRNKLPNNTAGKYDKITTNFFLEAGLKYRISKDFLIYGEGSLYVQDDDYLDDYANNNMADFYGTINFGLSYAFTSTKDEDDDGVPDAWDKCAFTPSNVDVDEFGCPIDEDIDGVPDYRDRCLGSPLGIEVNRFGCVFDDDRDGVPDYIDECENTPKNVIVDSKGCPVDSDNDGVPDYLDLCPDTEEGAEVDSSGCYVIDESKNFLESVIINFESGSTNIQEKYYSRLDRASFYMNEYNNIIWYIEGHSDNIERSDGTESVSLSRAKSVLDYLLRKGVSLSKLRVVDRKNTFNIADNTNALGREKNRRVVIFGIK